MSRRKAKRKATKRGLRMPTPTWLQWEKERNSCRDFLTKLRLCKTMGGHKWRDSMKAHYTKRLNELNDNEPKQYRGD